MSFFVHPQGICESTNVGEGTRIWAFAHVLAGATIGTDCNICDHVFIEDDVVIGDRVTVKSGVQLWDGVRVEDDVFIGPNATFTNDVFPRSKQHEGPKVTRVRKGASIGANATLLPGVIVGIQAMVGAGSMVTTNVPSKAVVVGNPARVIRYVDTVRRLRKDESQGLAAPQGESGVRGAALCMLKSASDHRGSLCVAEYGESLPFIPRRYFTVYDVPGAARGEHAHWECEQFLVCVKGSMVLVLDDGVNREEYVLDRPDTGVYVPPLVWAEQYRFTPDAVLMVLASHEYDPADYIRDYGEYLAIVQDQGRRT